MRVPLNLVGKYTKLPADTNQLIEKIGAQLGAVDETIDWGQSYKGIIIVRVVSCAPHPNADKLSVCKIDTGGSTDYVQYADEQGYVQVVCGAPNVAAGQLVAWISPGAVVPATAHKDPLVLEVRDIRGQKSYGMLGSPKELMLGESHEGILVLAGSVNPGTPLAEVYELNDTVIDIENKMFTHRPDCFGIIGVAREISGIHGQAFHSPDWYKQPLALPAPSTELPLSVSNDLPDTVPRFMAVAIADVTVGPSPLWMQSYLLRLGIRPINNVVDLTNYYMALTGQPLHAYDYDKLKAIDKGSSSVTLTARGPIPGEKIKLLGGKEIEPHSKAILIASATQVVGVGGIMGGQSTEVDLSTKNIVLECATFDMYSVRKSAMEHGLFTDAATRFTKGQSSLQNDRILAKAATHIMELTKGRVASKIFDLITETPAPGSVLVTAGFINGRLGLRLSVAEITSILVNVEFDVKVEGDSLRITAPFWRKDIHIEEDIVEEVGRLYGYDRLSLELPVRDLRPASKSKMLAFKSELRQLLSRSGANEVLTYSFVHSKLLDACGQDKEQAFRLSNALSPDLQYYRLSLLPSLLEKVHSNIKAGYDKFALFEINKTHSKDHMGEDDLPIENERLALVFAASGKASQSLGGAPYYQAVFCLRYLLEQLGWQWPEQVLLSEYQDSSKNALHMIGPFNPARASALVTKDNRLLGVVGEFQPPTSRAFKLPAFSAGYELDINVLLSGRRQRDYHPLSKFPSAEQDISFEVPSKVTYKALELTLKKALESASLEHGYKVSLLPLDIYRPSDTSESLHMTFRLVITHHQRTLITKETNKLLDTLAIAASDAHQARRL